MIQLQVLNKLLDSRDSSFLITNNITDEFFSDYVEEFRFIKNHLDTYNTIPDKATFLSSFPNFDIIVVNEPYDYLIDALYEDRNKRKLASIFNQIRELLNAGKTEDALNLYASSAEVAVQAKHLTSVDIIKDVSRYDDYVDRCNDFSKFYIKTGFTELDKLIGGWERSEELATIAARPGVGKSWVLLKCAIAALEQGLTVGIYSGEMSDRKVGYRFDTLISHISNYRISKGVVDIQNEYKSYIDSLSNRFTTGSLKVLTPSMINGIAGVSALRAFIEKDKLDILFVDQHSLLEDDRKARDPVTKAANISKDLKTLQVLKKIPIIAVSQQNREKTDNGATTANIAQSDRISQDSTILIFLEQKDSILTLNLVKSRDSENNRHLKYAINLDKGIFDFIPEEGNALPGEGVQELYEEYEYEEKPF